MTVDIIGRIIGTLDLLRRIKDSSYSVLYVSSKTITSLRLQVNPNPGQRVKRCFTEGRRGVHKPLGKGEPFLDSALKQRTVFLQVYTGKVTNIRVFPFWSTPRPLVRTSSDRTLTRFTLSFYKQCLLLGEESLGVRDVNSTRDPWK